MAIDEDSVTSESGGNANNNNAIVIGEGDVELGDAVGNEADVMGEVPELKFHCQALIGGLFDAFTITLAVADVVTDILIADEWLREGQMTFFWLGVSVFMLAQVGYAVLFAMMFKVGEYGSDCGSVVLFLVALPFGQLVPLVVWAVSIDFPGARGFLRLFNVRPRNEGGGHDHPDPVARYLINKLEAHGGFIIESMLEALPQSLIQLVYIVRVGTVQPLNVFSITLSIVSIASKGVVLAYHVDRPTFLFNYLCVVYDVFNIFTVVVWVFTFTSADVAYSFFVFSPDLAFNIYSTIWLWKEFLLACFGVLTILILLGIALYHNNDDSSAGLGIEWLCMCTMGILGIVGALPCFLVFEIVRFILIPLVCFDSINSLDLADTAKFYAIAQQFLFSGSDYAERYRCYVIASGVMDHWAYTDHHAGGAELGEPRVLSLRVGDEVRVRYQLRGNFNFATYRKHRGLTPGGVFEHYTMIDTVDYHASCEEQIKGFLVGFYLVVIAAPLVTLGSLYSFLFPLLAFFTRDVLGDDVPLLPVTLTCIQLGLLTLMLLLAPRVYRVAHFVYHRYGEDYNERVNTIQGAIRLYCAATDDPVEMYKALCPLANTAYRWCQEIRNEITLMNAFEADSLSDLGDGPIEQPNGDGGGVGVGVLQPNPQYLPAVADAPAQPAARPGLATHEMEFVEGILADDAAVDGDGVKSGPAGPPGPPNPNPQVSHSELSFKIEPLPVGIGIGVGPAYPGSTAVVGGSDGRSGERSHHGDSTSSSGSSSSSNSSSSSSDGDYGDECDVTTPLTGGSGKASKGFPRV